MQYKENFWISYPTEYFLVIFSLISQGLTYNIGKEYCCVDIAVYCMRVVP